MENNIINDIPTILPEMNEEVIINPFENDEFKNKWYDRYKNNGCTLDHIQRLYNIDKITKEDFIIITDQEPKEKTVQQPSELSKLKNNVNDLTNQVNSLKQENADIYFELMMLSESI